MRGARADRKLRLADVPGLGPVQAQVRWQLGVSMGGRFLDPISLARCEWTATPAEPPAAD